MDFCLRNHRLRFERLLPKKYWKNTSNLTKKVFAFKIYVFNYYIIYIFFSIFLLQRIRIFLLIYIGGVLGTALLETLFSPDGHCTTAYYRHGTQRRMSYWGGYQKSYPKTVLSYFVSPYTTQTSFLIIYLYFCLVYVLVKRIFRKKSNFFESLSISLSWPFIIQCSALWSYHYLYNSVLNNIMQQH